MSRRRTLARRSGAQGWTGFQRDNEADDWGYLAVCGNCQRNQIEQAQQRTAATTAMRTPPEQGWKEFAERMTGVETMPEVAGEISSEEVPETIACMYCDVDSPASLAAAQQEGWTDLDRDDGAGWNYLGLCPECREREQQSAEPETQKLDQQKRLFA